MAPPSQKQSSKKLVCGFFRPDGTVLSEATVRDAVAAAAVTERANWLAGSTLQMEQVPVRFGALVGYWLAGSRGGIRPDRLVAAQQAAATSGIPYPTLVHAALATAVIRFKAAAAKADTAIADVYAKWDAIDAAKIVVNAATAKVTARKADVTAAEAVVKAATAKVQAATAQVKAKTAPQSALDAARADLVSARGALAVANTALGTAERERDDAKKKHQTAVKARTAAKAAHTAAVSARDGLEKVARKIERANKTAVRTKIVAAAPAGSLSGLDASTLDEALEKAHDFASDIDAWSAVFVGSMVRAAAIALKLEGVVAGRHEGKGKEGLLEVSFRHAEYVIAARDRKKSKHGGYFAFEPKGRVIKKGDIIATDRVDEITSALKLPRLAGRRNLHCDIVVDVKTGGTQPYAETIGGNVTHTVRRRRYPLTATGEIVVSPTVLYLQEDDAGQFGTFSPLPTTPSVLKPRSSGRIFAILSLVEGCDMVADEGEIHTDVSMRLPWRVPAGEGASMTALEKLESPFLDEETFPTEPQERDWVSTREESFAEADDESLAPGDDDESESYDENESFDDSESVDQSESYDDPESLAQEDESTHEDLEEVSAEWESALLEAEEGDGSYELEEPETLLEHEDGELAAADSIDEAAAQCLFPQPVRDRLEPLLSAAAARAASTWNTARHPKVSGVSPATLLTRLERYINRSAVESAMQKVPGLKERSGDTGVVLAVIAHQFQQKIYTSTKAYQGGQVGEGTLDALGFVRHRGNELNAVDALNIRFHVKGRSKAFKRLQEVYRTDRAAFEQLEADVTPTTWYRLFVNAPFLGRPFTKGIHVELMRRLRRAEKWLSTRPVYKEMSPVEVGAAMHLDEDHHGGRTTANNSMHTLGLAVDIRYLKNPWVAGQHGNTGKPNTARNSAFQTVTRNVSRLLDGGDVAVTPAWLHGLASDPARTSESAYDEVQKRQTDLQRYLSFESDAEALKAAIERRRQGPRPERVVGPRETVEAAAARWRRTIRDDRARLQRAVGSSRRPAAGFMNLERALVCALRDHGCLAWGAIDLGSNASGDMMHFDCRATGIGWKLSLERQRTAGANHPCARPAPAAEAETEEWEAPRAPAVRPTVDEFLGGRLWSFTSSTLPMKVGVFCPKVLSSPKTVDVLVFVHGLLDRCSPEPKTTDELIKNKPFQLAKHVDASGRGIVLVAPFMDWPNLKTNGLRFDACFRDNMHLLGTPAKLNGVVREALLEVGRVFGSAAPSIQNLILAGHSKAYAFFDPLAMTHGDPEMSKGCLAKLSDVWALDTTYTCPTDLWLCWLASKPNLKMRIFFRNVPSTGTCGKRYASVATKTSKRMQVFPVAEGHCAVPATRLPKLLNPVPPKPMAKKELEQEDFEMNETETDADEGAEWESPADEAIETDGEEFEAEALDDESEGDSLEDERDLDPEHSEADDEHEGDDES